MMPSFELTPTLVALVRSGLFQQPLPASDLLELDRNGWEALRMLATSHDLLPLLSAGITASRLTVPDDLATTLRYQARTSELRNCLAWDQLSSLVAAFNKEGLEPTLLKGAQFAHRYYRTPGLRPFGDLDILVPLAARQQAEQILLRLGYRTDMGMDGKRQDWLSDTHIHWNYSIEGGLPVELHWTLTAPEDNILFDLEAYTRRSQPVAFPTGQAWAFSPEDEIVYLAVHIASHHLHVPLRQYTDLAVIVAASSLDWNCIWQRAAAVGVEEILAAYLGIASELGFLELPDAAATPVEKIWKDRSRLTYLAHYAVEWPYLEQPGGLGLILTAPTLKVALRRLREQAIPTTTRLIVSQTDTSVASTTQRHVRFWHERFVTTGRRLKRLPALWKAIRASLVMRRLFTHRRTP
jgi:hypothetical protein